jgi:negative regulator of flagellin synthesis FlgM
MAIESITGRTRPPITTGTGAKTEVGGGNKAPTKQAERTDSIVITATAKGIKKAFESASTDSVVDMDRVAAVKKSLADGSYQINAERVADKMIQHEKLMSKN